MCIHFKSHSLKRVYWKRANHSWTVILFHDFILDNTTSLIAENLLSIFFNRPQVYLLYKNWFTSRNIITRSENFNIFLLKDFQINILDPSLLFSRKTTNKFWNVNETSQYTNLKTNQAGTLVNINVLVWTEIFLFQVQKLNETQNFQNR